MSLSGDEFIRLIILLLPGFWGLWIYKPFVYRGDEEFMWERDFILAVMFALPGYLIITSIPGLSQSPIIFQVAFSVLMVIIVSVTTGLFLRKYPHPLYWFAAKDSTDGDKEIDTPYGQAVSYIRERLINKEELREGYTPLAIIYHIGNRENAEIGSLVYHSTRFNEVVLDTRPPITLDQIKKNDGDIGPWVKSVNLDTGIVVEVANIKTEIIDRIYDQYYDASTSSPADYPVSSEAVA